MGPIIDNMREEMLSTFPYSNNISKDSLKEIVEIALSINIYRKSLDVIYALTEYHNPTPQNVDYTPGSEYAKWWDWRDQIWKWMKNHYLPLWKCINGNTRTFEAACELCANIWMNKIFQVPLQDNGAWNDGHTGAMMNILGSALKADAMSTVSEEIQSKVKEGIREYYLKNQYGYGLNCDYNPCPDLYNILKDAGIPQNVITSITPWKTNIQMMVEDNSVLVRTYQHDEYL
ncbi:MAG: hypothetical protein K2L55_10520 [Muribaculaceae bacterium]|nr:hypothetical protein [Muribaculaceae bacterium]